MDPILINAEVQMWSAKAGMSKSRRAFIETLIGKMEAKLILYFSTGKVKPLQLQDNIKNVVLRTFGEDQNYLYLTFQNNNFLFVEKLTTTDAKQLKRFLDKVYQDSLLAARRNDKGRSGGPSTSTQELGGSSPLKVHSEAISKYRETTKERKTAVPSELPLPSSSSATPKRAELLENQLVKKKKASHHSERKGIENTPKGSREEFETKLVAFLCNDKEKETGLGEAERSKTGFELPSVTEYTNELDFDVQNINDLLEQLFSPFLLEPYYIEEGVEWHEYMKMVLLNPEKTRQGLPNVGNSCYINVVVQSLCSVPLFVNDLFNQGFPWVKPPRDSFNMHLMQLLVLKDIYSMTSRKKLLKSIIKALPVFGILTAHWQNDAHEFLSLCLVQLKETIQRLALIWQSEGEYGGNNLLREIFANHAAIDRMPVCPVASNFDFELISSIFCKDCGLTVFKREPNSYISINIPQRVKDHRLSIQTSLDLFLSAEELEHRCERCMHNKSIALHKFSCLPRVMIIHLKRYSVDESWVMKKDEQHVIASKYLRLSHHCNKNTKLPQPLGSNSHAKDIDLLKPLEELGFEILSMPYNSVMASRSEGFPTVSVRSDKESESQNVKREQQEDLREGATSNIVRSELTNKMKKIKEHGQDNTGSNLDSGSTSEATKNDVRIQKKSQKHQQALKCNEDRSEKQPSIKALTQSHSKPSFQEQPENLRKPKKSHTQSSSRGSPASPDSRKTPGNKDVFDKKTRPIGKVGPQNSNPKDKTIYRLISIINHIGSSPDGGHYISDAFDFRKRCWFSYNDQQVTSIHEDFVQKARSSTGYVFFYMHNDIFEELLARGAQSKQ
ncbi:ubiquitin carboxyl-terminal hydrolase 26 [Acomys russatus]|uniref:ubiquitin carboxyl-terminal hydrolase 26 n=1 Tax=Acomys russatus TaxID=60746 RepID=UPI0021E23DC7|nr:ubiquitin carboxyl-terminal hydrolase 26 [Acomys russatus]